MTPTAITAATRLCANWGFCCATCCARARTFPAASAGDEFVIISSNTSATSLLTVAERIQREFTAQHNGLVTLSIGTSLLEPDDTAQSLLERCDKANYQAKAQGGNTIVHLQTNTPEH